MSRFSAHVSGPRVMNVSVYCWRALARQHTILVIRGKNPKILSDVRLDASAVEHYPG